MATKDTVPVEGSAVVVTVATTSVANILFLVQQRTKCLRSITFIQSNDAMPDIGTTIKHDVLNWSDIVDDGFPSGYQKLRFRILTLSLPSLSSSAMRSASDNDDDDA